MSEVRAGGVLVFRGVKGESFLLMRHRHRLDLPKGHLEPGESDLEGALRELWEETGIRKEDIDIDPGFLWTTEYDVDGRRYGLSHRVHKTVVIYLGYLHGDVKIQCSEHLGFEWIPWNPPHAIQAQTIDPLLAAVAEYRGNDRMTKHE